MGFSTLNTFPHRDEQVSGLQRELAGLVSNGARRDDDMVRRENEHKDQLEHELGYVNGS